MVNKILVVDHERAFLDSVSKRLVAGGYKVFVGHNGQEAYELSRKYTPDVIVTDTAMPDMNGFELCKALKKDAQTKDIPIIVMSTKSNMADSFLFLGIKDFLQKPFPLEVLEKKIQEGLDMARAMHVQKTKILFHCVKALEMASAKSLIESVPQWSAQFVPTGEELLRKAQEFVPDLIVIDLFMCDMPVDEVVAKLKAMPDLEHSAILTYYSGISAAQDSFALQAKMIEVQYLKRVTAEAGATEYLGPFSPVSFMRFFNSYRKDLRDSN